MRHGKKVPKLGRTASHRKALLRNMATSLILKEKITTTIDKAKALRPFIEKIISRAKTDTLHNKREVHKKLTERRAVIKLFSDIAPRYGKRPGGYTRIFKLGTRPGDAAEMAIIELVEEEFVSKTGKKKAKAVKGETKTAPVAETAAVSSEPDPEGSVGEQPSPVVDEVTAEAASATDDQKDKKDA